MALLVIALGAPMLEVAGESWRFDFGPGAVEPGFRKVETNTFFTAERGYGLETNSGPNIRSTHCQGTNALLSDCCTAAVPFLFSVAVPEGNYLVSVIFGDAVRASTNTVKAESRRLMIESLVTAPGQFATSRFTVNIRTPRIRQGENVRLKARERGVLHWDPKLTLEFNGFGPAVCALEISAAPDLPTIYLLGDSTVTDQPDEPWNSWGQMLTRFFGPGIAVANHAESGESLRSARGAGRIEKVLSSLKAGDYVLVQFGHNDQKDKSTNAAAAFEAGLGRLVEEVKAKDATPVLVTSMERKSGVQRDTLAGYPEIVRKVAGLKKVPVIDLNRMSRVFYQALGQDLDRAFVDGTHHSAYGSYELARCVVKGMGENVPDLAKYLVEEGNFNPEFPDAWQDFNVPPSLAFNGDKPAGN